jgi:pimeloyl-ACP methyl ester carboxylesterase
MPSDGLVLRPIRPHQRLTAIATAVAASVLVASIPTHAAEATIAWEPCAERFQCGSVTVPWDHADPEAGQLEIPVVRQPAKDLENRQGVLVYNPGGPGVPGAATLMAVIDIFPAAIQERFDILAFDPRGTGGAGHVDCGTDVAAMYALDPRSGSDSGDAATAWAALAGACADVLAAHAGDVSTTSVARDVELIREALGEEQIAWFVTSYGTRLAAEHLRLFPDRVTAAVLDGAMDPSAALPQQAADQVSAAEEVLGRLLSACWWLDPCPIAGDPTAAYDGLEGSLAAEPLTTPEGIKVGPATLQAAALAATSLPILFGQSFADALVAAQGGDGRGLLTVGPGSATETFDPQWAILCSDESGGRGAIEAGELATRLASSAPRSGLGGAIGWGIGCQAWPEPAQPLAPFTEPTTIPVLVVGSTGDPSTPYAWSERMAEALDATLLTREGDGHTAFFNTFLAGCTGAAITEFLLDPENAAPPASCPD